MSILSRLVRVFKGVTNDALDTIEDPGSVARQMVRDLKASITQHEEATAKVSASQKVLQGRYDNATEEVAQWLKKARQAVQAQRDDLAQEALRRVGSAERSQANFKASLDILNPQVEALKLKLEELRTQHDDAENDAILFDARAKAAAASGEATRMLGSVGAAEINFDAVRNRVEQMEAGSAALEELSRDKNGTGVTAELNALGVQSVEQRLQELKQEVAEQRSEV
jgi:phage shock protein A